MDIRVTTVGQLKEILSNLNDEDVLVIETTDEDENPIDLYPMYVDIIKLDNKSNEVRLCQMNQKFFKP